MYNTKSTHFLWVAGAIVFFILIHQTSEWNQILAKITQSKEDKPGYVSPGISITEPVIKPVTKHDPNKPRYIFVDLGANSADSLAVFLQHDKAKFKYNFPSPDWATHNDAGEYISRISQGTKGHSECNSDILLGFPAEIYLFEANPYFNTALVEAKEQNNALGIKVNIFPSTVVDVKDGTRTFFLDTVNSGRDFWGSSIYATHPDARKSKSNGTELSAVNISRWLLMNFLPRDFVVVKMDIEGAEFQIIPHMVEMSSWLVVDHLMIEWHPVRYLGGGTKEDTEFHEKRAKAAVAKLKEKGVSIPAYNSPA